MTSIVHLILNNNKVQSKFQNIHNKRHKKHMESKSERENMDKHSSIFFLHDKNPCLREKKTSVQIINIINEFVKFV